MGFRAVADVAVGESMVTGCGELLEPLAMSVLDEFPGFLLRRLSAIAGGRVRVEESSHVAGGVRLLDHDVLVRLLDDMLEVGEKVSGPHDERVALRARAGSPLRRSGSLRCNRCRSTRRRPCTCQSESRTPRSARACARSRRGTSTGCARREPRALGAANSTPSGLPRALTGLRRGSPLEHPPELTLAVHGEGHGSGRPWHFQV